MDELEATLPADGAEDPAPALQARFPKQAIVVVHGMGEQRPMDTIKDFVRTVWQGDAAATNNNVPNPTEVWSKPDERLGSLELRRITTRESAPSPGVFDRGVRNDFFELYWADLTAGTPWEEFVSWLRYLLFRNPVTNLPHTVRLAWIALWLVTIVFVILGVLAAVPPGTVLFGRHVPDFGSYRWLVLPLLAALGTYTHSTIQKTFGRVVRYTRATPSNIAARKAVRDRGLALLETLHNDIQYDRIILVGHSLGTILAYELLAFFWARKSLARQLREGTPAFAALMDLEQVAPLIEERPDDPALLLRWRDGQRSLRYAMAARHRNAAGGPDDVAGRWIISDFVTLGSPLTHAEFLMAAGRADLDERMNAREMPCSPPVPENLDPANFQAAIDAGMIAAGQKEGKLFSFPWRDPEKTWELHHAAVFCAVRWTNIFDHSQWIFKGDLISGPLRDAFGPGVIDIDLREIRGQAHGFTHTLYWDRAADARQLDVLRRAVNLLDRPPGDVWAGFEREIVAKPQ
ncbi:hypothetical protein ELH33_33060 (plasmid) [Rhizobium ruizarguesonis]|uniref:hypothetical protein n=1 Tax=Rhizobium ruizarguesonis TaxID=2081791 RepID=UPI0010323539|nr:hypothetical protein [Rhizobium ruizarguesonis]TBC25606.1 hypothetical protein ELH33_33060 [Rhizobium ruizarguesonis]